MMASNVSFTVAVTFRDKKPFRCHQYWQDGAKSELDSPSVGHPYGPRDFMLTTALKHHLARDFIDRKKQQKKPVVTLVSFGLDAHRDCVVQAGNLDDESYCRYISDILQLGCRTVVIAQGGYKEDVWGSVGIKVLKLLLGLAPAVPHKPLTASANGIMALQRMMKNLEKLNSPYLICANIFMQENVALFEAGEQLVKDATTELQFAMEQQLKLESTGAMDRVHRGATRQPKPRRSVKEAAKAAAAKPGGQEEPHQFGPR